jgi:hypothetical protein
MKLLRLWTLGWGVAAVVTSALLNLEMYRASKQLAALREQTSEFNQSLEAFNDSLDVPLLMLDMQFDDMLRDVQAINCSMEPNYELRVACALKIEWPKDV